MQHAEAWKGTNTSESNCRREKESNCTIFITLWTTKIRDDCRHFKISVFTEHVQISASLIIVNVNTNVLIFDKLPQGQSVCVVNQ